MRLDLAQDIQRRIPVVAVASEQGVAMKAGQPCELRLGVSGRAQPLANVDDEVLNHGLNKSISGYALQGRNAYRNMLSYCYSRRMEKTPDERRAILRKHISDNRLKVAPWAKSAGVDKNSIYNFLNGHSQALDPMTYAKLARASRVPSWKLSGEMPEPPSPTSIWVIGKVQAGVFVDAVEWDQSDWYAIDVPVPPRFRSKAKALLVAGASMDLEYKEGSIVIWVDMLDFRPPQHGDHVIAFAYDHHREVEATVKELRISEDGKRWLWPRSSKPEFQAPICVDDLPPDIVDVEVKGIVIGDYRPRVN